MSATTPAVRGGIGTQRLGAALAAIALAIIVLVALVGLQASASRTVTLVPAAVPAPAPASLYDHGSAADSGKLSSPMFTAPHLLALPRVFDPYYTPKTLLALPRVFDPSYPDTAPVGGGRGTRFAQ
jgi:hypothetical protein